MSCHLISIKTLIIYALQSGFFPWLAAEVQYPKLYSLLCI